MADIIPPEHVVTTAADPREIEYVIESPDGKTRSEWRRPEPEINNKLRGNPHAKSSA